MDRATPRSRRCSPCFGAARRALGARRTFPRRIQLMRTFVTFTGRWLRAGWFLPLGRLVLPTCSLPVDGIGPPPVFDPGPEPQSSAVMCDIPKVPAPGSDGCATSQETGLGMPLAHAAVALAQGE